LHQVAQSNIGVVPLFRLLVACTMMQLPPWSPAPTRWSSEAVQFGMGSGQGPGHPDDWKGIYRLPTASIDAPNDATAGWRLWKADKGFRNKFNVSEEAREDHVSLKSVMHRLLRGKLIQPIIGNHR